MADESVLISVSALKKVHENIKQHGYALTSEPAVGLPVKFSKYLQDNYFDNGMIQRHEGDIPEDRERARDVVYYEWDSSKLELVVLEEYETVTIRNRSGIEGERVHKRIELLQDQQVRDLIATFISLVPRDRRQAKGTFGVNLFRTHTDVVTRPHRDEEEFIILYVLGREGDGAESYLYKDDSVGPGVPEGAEPVFRQQLDRGEMMIFEDSRFKHGATPLTPPSGAQAKRDVLICTVDYRTTYLQPGTVS